MGKFANLSGHVAATMNLPPRKLHACTTDYQLLRSMYYLGGNDLGSMTFTLIWLSAANHDLH